MKLLRKDVETLCTVRDGLVVTPARLRGLPLFVAYFWLEEEAIFEEDGDTSFSVDILDEDRAEFPEIPSNVRTIILERDLNGAMRFELIFSKAKG